MTTWYTQGFVTAPDGPDRASNSVGYDNAGFFGPSFANLGGDPFLVTWAGTNCHCFGGPGDPFHGPTPNPVTDVILTINNMSVEFTNNVIWDSEWFVPGFIQAQAVSQLPNTFPPQIVGSLSGTISTDQLYANGQGNGAAYLQDIHRPYQTDLHLTVTHMGPQAVPAPMIGAGMPGIILAIGALVWLARQRRTNKLRLGTYREAKI